MANMPDVYIIRLDSSKLSKTLSQDAYDSVTKFDITPKYFGGIERNDADRVLNKFGLKPVKSVEMEPAGTRGCLASHYILWVKAIETGEPIVVMEHDGLMLRDVREILYMVDDTCHLDPKDTADPLYQSEVYFDEGIGVKEYIKIRREGLSEIIGIKNLAGTSTVKFKGGYGYVITPKGASKLIEFYKVNEIPAADTAITKNVVNLQITLSTYVRLHPYYKDARTILDFSTRKREDL
jgi:GR25 family glycosyltransferase involved in LPS biosynthesis